MRAVARGAGGSISTFHGKGMVWFCLQLVVSMACPACLCGLLYKFISGSELPARVVLRRDIAVAAGAWLRSVYGLVNLAGTDKDRNLFLVLELHELAFGSVAREAEAGIFGCYEMRRDEKKEEDSC
jgi:hypothetical protein